MKGVAQYKVQIGVVILISYVVILGIGTVAELFNIQSVLDWWIFRPPGR